MNLPDLAGAAAGGTVDGAQKRNVAGGGAITAGVASGDGGNGSTAGGHLDPSSQLMTYKTPGGTAPGSNVFGDYIDLNELLNLEGGTEEDNSILI